MHYLYFSSVDYEVEMFMMKLIVFDIYGYEYITY